MNTRSSETIPGALHGERVDRVVALLTGMARSEVAALVAAGGVRVGGRTVTTRSHRLVQGDHLEVSVPERVSPPDLQPDASVPVTVVHEDSHVVVVDKAAGVVVHPGSGRTDGTLVQGLLARFPDLAEIGAGEPDRPGIVHRLDKGTSGLLVVARTAAAYRSLVDQLKRRAVDRRYLCLVWGHLASPDGLVDAPVGRSGSDPTRMVVSARGRPARTRYHVRRRVAHPALTLLECRLETGRTHQVRVHLASIGHPVVGDDRYGGARSSLVVQRPFLHAHHLAFEHPASGEILACSSPLPADLEAALAACP
ncbi:MAG: RluA family pseudouridine synthase [Actinomycetota bacterium]|nr:RluA family pseudouridine synthase [Actinomycetota bacterium]MDQ3681022.1 RluA family pseudouridine synthase [Actinomycetota bacterium]